jgi:hypothetical protein
MDSPLSNASGCLNTEVADVCGRVGGSSAVGDGEGGGWERVKAAWSEAQAEKHKQQQAADGEEYNFVAPSGRRTPWRSWRVVLAWKNPITITDVLYQALRDST